MTVFKRTILFGLCMLLVFLSLPYLLFDSLHSYISETQLSLSVVVGSVIGLYNFLMIYKRATTIVVVDSESIRRKIEEQKGEDNYV